MLSRLLITISFLLFGIISIAQDADSIYHDTSKYVHFYSYTNPLMLESDAGVDDVNKKIKKKKERGFLGIFKKKIYFGYRVRRGFVRSGYGKSTINESFHTLKVPFEASEYVRDIYWYHIRKRLVKKTTAKKVDPEFGFILHGPYKKTDRENNILEEGSYYIGTKHKTWMTYSKNRDYKVKDTVEVEGQVLLSKVKYYKGWPEESEISYYDKERKKIKEITPILHGKKEGAYHKFYKNGWHAQTGFYSNDKKVGLWTEHYPYGRLTSLRKQEVKYPDNPYDLISEPILQRAWDKKGKVVFDIKKRNKK